ncbi:MAG: FadR/GntR family transcriptional regulator [Egibacteraceae bacterium]
MSDDGQHLRRTLRTVTPTRLTDGIAEELRRYIVENELTQGARLPSERALAEVLGASRATVSQALRQLALLGLLEIRQGSGAYVRNDPGALFGSSLDLILQLEPASVTELAELRYWLEQYVLGGNRQGRSGREPLSRAFDALVTSKGSVPQWLEADAAFHLAFVASAGNRYLSLLYRNLHHRILSLTYSNWVRRGTTPAWLRGQRLGQQLALHRRIMEAAGEEDYEGLAASLSRHQEHLMEHLAAALHATP